MGVFFFVFFGSLGDRSLATTLQECRFDVRRVGDIKKSKKTGSRHVMTFVIFKIMVRLIER